MAERDRGSGAAVTGRRAVLEAVRAGLAREVLVAHGVRTTGGLRDLLAAARAAGIPVRRVTEARIDEVAEGAHHQGVAAVVAAAPELGERDLEVRSWPEDALVLVLDGVTDPHNVGAVARTAEAAGAEALVMRRARGGGLTPAAVRASAGALLHLPTARVPNVARAVSRLQEASFWVVGLEEHAAATIWEAAPPPGRLALVVGSEGEGLSRLVREKCDELLAIPVAGRVSSLNVSVAAGVALFAYAGRRRGS